MRYTTRLVARIILLAAAAAAPSQCLAIAITNGADSTGALGATANAIVRISDPGGLGSGTVIDVENFPSGRSICILTADHVIRNSGGGGSTLYDANQITVSFGNSGGGGASFTSHAVATIFDLPNDGSNSADLAMIHVFVPNALVNTLPVGLAAAALPGAGLAANAGITQAGYGLQAGVANVSGAISYVYSTVNALGAGYGTLKAGPNTVNNAGVVGITGAVSVYAGQNYAYQGYENGALIAGAGPNYPNSTSYIFSGDSGGPSLTGNTVVGVHSSSFRDPLQNDPNAEFAKAANANYRWQDVSVFDYLDWINEMQEVLCVPEPGSFVLFACGGLALLLCGYRRVRQAK